MVNEDATIPLPCPGCGEKTEKTVRWFKTKPDSFECSGCGKTVHLNPDEVAEVVAVFDGIDESIAKLKRSFEGR